jgi:phosphoribosylanthranilate isomerase
VADVTNPWYIKICGVTTLGDANAVIDAGATALGLILARSPRQLSLDRALALAEATKGRIVRTAVFRDERDNDIVEALDVLDVDAVQIHGTLGPTLLKELRSRNVAIVKALSIGSEEFYDFDENGVDYVLVDGASPGSGLAHSWDDLASRRFAVPVIAAGGLRPELVADVIAETTVWGVDTASGVESSPGVKDRDALMTFVNNARDAFERRVAS